MILKAISPEIDQNAIYIAVTTLGDFSKPYVRACIA